MATNKTKPAKQGGPRSAARLAVVQAFYQLSMADEPNAAKTAEEYISHRLGAEIEGDQYVAADADLFKDILIGAWDRRDEWNKLIEAHLSQGWTLDRIDKILMAALSAGSYELSARIDVPTAVVINEYVDVVHGFYENAEAAFVNSVLDKIAKQVRS
ncbi:MAG: transcription antitermination factor NusB [Kordiimonadaceae bacterium]|nr:transcription antitermination factor NusB [Kordiimonadaceae bacterium]MBO6570395.1 transcription antitermination factor NusB [Kordiimonadaceae bacterium]MBO6965507.1 transcription antitermination factor NusB [Kordiimonadaceae bacterium]